MFLTNQINEWWIRNYLDRPSRVLPVLGQWRRRGGVSRAGPGRLLPEAKPSLWRPEVDRPQAVSGSGSVPAVRLRLRPRRLFSAGPSRSTEMASAAAPVSAVAPLAPPLEQLQHLAGELRLLLLEVRGELTQLGRTTVGTDLGGEEGVDWRRQGRGPGWGGGDRRWLCLLLFLFATARSTLHTHPVGEAQETTKEFNRETFWRRLSECLSC